LLSDERLIYNVIKEETIELKGKYGDERKTEISEIEEEEEIEDESLIEEEKMIVTITHKGYVKRLPLTTYKQQKRGGKGVRGAGMRDEDFIEDIFVASTHSYLLCFTNTGIVHWLKVYKLPEGSRQARGKAIVNLLPLKKDEYITTIIPVRDFLHDMNLVAVTKNGIIKKTSLGAYSRPRKGGIIAITLDPEDRLIQVKLTTGEDEIMIGTANGMAARFSEKNVRSIGRSGKGVRGIKLAKDDRVIGMIVVKPSDDILTVTENGYGKRTAVEQYRKIFRGGKGVTNIKTSERNGKVVTILGVTDKDDIMFISKHGIVIRTDAGGISRIGRATQGFRLMRLKPGDKVVAAAKFVSEEVENNNGGD
ncbi:DNA gyrase subunit A, partial [Candidatus Woesearchaeota archaeon]|nr:DNA gyrase subunit A [Candidatus Woesearchaeota archaeon]